MPGYDFIKPQPLHLTRLVKPGRYRIVFHYSTDSPDVWQWRGSGEVPEGVGRILRQVPRVQLEGSTDIMVAERQVELPNQLVQAWIEIHREDLLADWELAVSGQQVFPIEPLR